MYPSLWRGSVLKYMTALYLKLKICSESTCEVRGIGEGSEHVPGNPDERYFNWEDCAQRCREHDLCSHWVVEVGYYFTCYLRQGTYNTGSPTYDYSRYILGYRDCTPGRILIS